MNAASTAGPTPQTGPLPWAYDPVTTPEYFRGVLGRRFVAFLIDVTLIGAGAVAGTILLVLFGLLTFGAGFALFGIYTLLLAGWALVYLGLGYARYSATLGMRLMELELRLWHGGPSYFLIGALHAVLLWASLSLLTPFVLIVGLLDRRRRLLHDMVLGVVVVNAGPRVAAARLPIKTA